MSGPADLESLVRSYSSSGDEVSHECALAALTNDRPMWPRTEFDPGHFTASGFVASPDGESLLMIHHARLQRWLQPGGHIEPMDTAVEDAARREVTEETGISDLVRVGTSILRIDAHPIPARHDEPPHTHIDLGVGFVSGTFAIGPIDEVLDAAWVPFAELAGFDTDDAVRRGADALRATLA
ncbi:MAG: NUDIX hydrolase [Acidimicrobiia bacterium]